MATTITTRAGKGSALTHAEMDGNLTALRDTADGAAAAGSAATAHATSTSNPHSVTKTQVGLGNVDNTADLAKPVSTAQAAAIAAAVTAHEQAADPHPAYLTQTEAGALYSPAGAYVKPADGIPRQDLDHTIRGQLDLADTALQPGAQLTQAVVSSTTAAGAALMTGADAAAQRAALGLGTAATTASTAYATAAQGTKADAALPATADAIADTLEAAATGAPADLARIQASVSGYAMAPTSDGTVPMAVELNQLFAAAAGTVGGLAWLRPGSTYLIDRPLFLPAGVTLVGMGAEIKRAPQVATTTTTTLVSGVTTQITVASTAGLSVGLYIAPENGGVYDALASRRITAIAGNLVTVDSAFALSATGTTNIRTAFNVLSAYANTNTIGVNFNGNRANFPWARWELVAEFRSLGSNCIVDLCKFYEIPGEGVCEGGALIPNLKTGCKYTRNDFRNVGGNGFHFSGSKGTECSRNTFNKCNLDLLVGHVGGGITFSDYCFGVVVDTNHINDCYGGVGEIDCWHNSHAKIINNTIKRCPNHSVWAKSGNANSPIDGVLISGNHCFDSGPIHVGSTAAATSGTTTINTTAGSSAITITGALTHAGIGVGITGAGIPANTVIGWRVDNAAVLTTIYGDEVLATATATGVTATLTGRVSTGIKVINNPEIYNCGPGNNVGAINVGLTENLSIQNNEIQFPPTDTVSFGVYFGLLIAGVQVQNNTIDGGAIAVRGSTAGGSNVQVTGNTCRNQHTNGIDMRNVAPYTLCNISLNTLSHNKTAGGSYVGITPGSGCTVKGNEINLTGSGYRDGIRINASANVVVKGNTARVGTAGSSIRVEAGSTGYVVADNEVSKAITDTPAVGTVRNNDLIV